MPLLAADWPQWGGRNERNFASDEKGLPTTFSPGGEKIEGDQKVRAAPDNLKWAAKLGSQTYGNPTVSAGRVFIGTNDAGLADPRIRKTGGGLVLCLEEATGKVLWRLPVPRLKTREKSFNYDNMNLGVCSSPTVDGDRVYVTSNRGEVLCLDVRGQADGNGGPFADEGQYMAGTGDLPSKPGRFDPKDAPAPPPPVQVGPADGDILWIYDFLVELDSWPQDAVDCSVLVHGDAVYACTSNGVDLSHRKIPSPNCPDLIVLDKKTGKLLAVNDPPIGNAIFHGEWSSPALAAVGGRTLVVWGGGDGVCYAFDARPDPGEAGKPGKLKTVWRFDCNAPHNKFRNGQPLPYNKNREGPSEIIATPVFYRGRIYVGVGQDSRHGNGPGCLSCIDAAGTGDISESGKVWQCFGVQRSFSSVSAREGLIFMADYAGIVHCLDADTGRVHWTHDLGAHVWGSTFAADGKVYIGDEKGKVTVLAAAKEKKVLHTAYFGVPVYTTPIAANGVLYIASQTHLYAFQAPK
ncbi:MAG: pyrrolo-quinoline quinone [Planctomycetes bacterium]|nr:pyrrolo-quinoline quinone [Planctomycetota bacterium]